MKLIFPFVLLLFTTNLIAQSNEIKAKSEYFAAEEDYNNANYRQCISHLNTAETLLGNTNTRILYLKIKAYCNLKEYSSAYEAQKKYFELATDPDDPKFNEIVRLLSEINENVADDYLKVGRTYLGEDKYALAITEINKALKIDPEYHYAYYYLAEALRLNKEYDKAVSAYSKARTSAGNIENENDRTQVLYYIALGKGHAYYHLGKYDFALISYRNAINALPDIPYPYYLIARPYARLNNISKSIEYLELALQRGYDNFEEIENDPDMNNIITTNEYKELKTLLFDKRDNQIYKTVTIGNQVWMAENLNYETDDSWCYDNDTVNCRIYGRLYTWEAAMNACPDGWHLPTDEEWKELEIFLGMSRKEADKKKTRGTNEGSRLKSTYGWDNNGNGDNTTGFSALPGGHRDYTGSFYYLGRTTYFWSFTEYSYSAWYRVLLYNYSEVSRNYGYRFSKNHGFSVRCLRDY
jgi:uncharacterized protein (TIGR02145 family)